MDLDSQHPAYRYLRTYADSRSSVAHVHLTVRHCQSLQWSYDAARIRPYWKKSDYIEKRATLDYSDVDQNDLIPLPDVNDLKTDFNSLFTYLTVFTGKYMDENREQ